MELKQILIVYLIFSVIVGILAAWDSRKDSPQLMFIVGLTAAPFVAFLWVVWRINDTYNWWIRRNRFSTHTNGRHPAELFQIVIDYIETVPVFDGGICNVLSTLTCADVLTAHEHSWLMSYLSANVTLRRYLKGVNKGGCWWESGKKKPRLKYLQRQRTKYMRNYE